MRIEWSHSRTHRKGFTLLELMIAIVLGAGLLMSARLLLEQLTRARDTLATSTRQTERRVADERVLRELLRGVEMEHVDTMSFVGTEHDIRFTTWCDSAAGLRGRCRVTLAVDTILSVTDSAGEMRVFRRSVEPGRLRYLSDAGNGGRWVKAWTGTILLPLAVGIIMDNDTTVLRIGTRG